MSKYRTVSEKRELAKKLFEKVSNRNPEYIIYTDGGHTGDRTVGAYAIVVQDWRTKKLLHIECHPFTNNVTNNSAESQAIELALLYIERKLQIHDVLIMSDSMLCVNTVSKWLWDWVKHDTIKEKANSNIWKRVFHLLKKTNFNTSNIIHCRGHNPRGSNPGNDLADKLCGLVSKSGKLIVKAY